MKPASTLLLVALFGIVLGNAAAAQYTVTLLQAGTGGNTYAVAINNAGAVLGSAYDNNGLDNGVIWRSGVARPLPIADWSYGSRGLALNQAGHVAGYEYGAHGQNWATVWSATEKRYFPQNTEYGQVADINSQGAVVVNSGGGYRTSMLWSGAQDGQLLPALSARFDDTDPASPMVPRVDAWAMNDLNHVVGASDTGDHAVHAVLWRDGRAIDLHGTMGQGSVARDINNAGQILVNTSLADNTARIGLWQAGSLRYLDPTGGMAEGLAINAVGTVVGWAGIGSERHAFLWQDGLARDLNSMIAGAGEFAYLEAAYGINDLGQIVGHGRSSDGAYRAFLLTPVPEPGQWVMLVFGLAVLCRKAPALSGRRSPCPMRGEVLDEDCGLRQI